MPTKTWVVGEEVLAADFNTMVQRQVVATFANAAARDAALPSPTAGMMCYLATPPALQVYGTVWRTLPAGVLGYAETAINSGEVGNSPSPSVPLQVAVAIPEGRRIRVHASLPIRQSGAPGISYVYIYQDGVPVVQTVQYMGASQWAGMVVERIIYPAAGSHVYVVYIATSAGTVAIAGADGLGSLTVEDVGGA